MENCGLAYRAQRRVYAIETVVVPGLVVFGAIPFLPPQAFSLSGVALALGMWCIVGGLGVSVGLHRHFTHHAFRAPRWLRYVLGGIGAMAGQGPLLYWVSVHRCHHRYADRAGDPHSPNALDGSSSRIRAFLHGHILWMLTVQPPSPRRYAPDLLKDPVARNLTRGYHACLLSGIALPAVFGAAIGGTLADALVAAYWGGAVRLFVGSQITWCINSLCHSVGARAFATGDESRNLWWLALISFGEAWHNNHHAAPTAAVFSTQRWQVDPGGLAIKAMAAVGLVSHVRYRS